MNGLVDLDCDGSFAFITQNGSSVTDFFVLSNDLCYREILYFQKVEDPIESAHMPVVLTLGKPCDKVVESAPRWMDKIVWDQTKESDFLQRFFQRALKEIEHNIDVALSTFNDGIMLASQYMKKTGKSDRHSCWR